MFIEFLLICWFFFCFCFIFLVILMAYTRSRVRDAKERLKKSFTLINGGRDDA